MADTVSPSFHPGARVYPDGNAIILSGRQSGDTNDRFQLTSDGRTLISGGDAPAFDVAPYEWSDPLTTAAGVAAGQTAPQRLLVHESSVAGTAVSQRLALTHFRACRTETVTRVRSNTGTTAAGATPTLVQCGIYSDDGTNMTLVASTPNDTSLFASTSTAYPKSLSAPLTLIRGHRYAVGWLVVTGAALPTHNGLTLAQTSAPFATQTLEAPVVCSFLAAQATLPTSFAISSLSGAHNAIYTELLP